jgi:hypothetical protein
MSYYELKAKAFSNIAKPSDIAAFISRIESCSTRITDACDIWGSYDGLRELDNTKECPQYWGRNDGIKGMFKELKHDHRSVRRMLKE